MMMYVGMIEQKHWHVKYGIMLLIGKYDLVCLIKRRIIHILLAEFVTAAYMCSIMSLKHQGFYFDT